MKVDVVVTAGTPSIITAQETTSVIPILFATAGDPVACGNFGATEWERLTTGCRISPFRILAPPRTALAMEG
jgi:ABC-type uncharacterized transport system substrate-binding protein